MLSELKKEIIRNIESNIERGVLVNGVYERASFTYGKNNFLVEAKVLEAKDGKVTESSVIYKNGVKYRGSIVSNGRYRNIALGGGDSLMEHQLLAVCLLEGASKRLIEDDKAVINHKTILRESVEARERKIQYYNQCFDSWFDKSIVPDKSLLEVGDLHLCDVYDLEVCSSAENYAHGAFVATFNLYGYRISALDVPKLKLCMINDELVRNVLDAYYRRGIDYIPQVALEMNLRNSTHEERIAFLRKFDSL